MQQAEVFAFTRAKGFTPAGRNAGGRFVRKPGGRGQCASGGAAREMPPRGRSDMICVDCNRKGHTASECRQPRVERKDRKCFICDKPGHEANACPNRSLAAPRPVEAIEDAGPRRAPSVFFVTEKPKSQKARFGDFIGAPDRHSASTDRFRPLSLGIWQEIAAEVKSTESITSVTFALTLDSADVPPLCSHTSPKSVPLAPRGQGEIGGFVHSSQGQAQTCVSNCSCPIGSSHHDDQDLSAKAISGQGFVVGTRFGDGGSGSSIAIVGVGGKRIETKHASFLL